MKLVRLPCCYFIKQLLYVGWPDPGSLLEMCNWEMGGGGAYIMGDFHGEFLVDKSVSLHATTSILIYAWFS
jgi:hypothetical protein